MEERADASVAFSHMATLATLSVVALLGLGVWQISQFFLKGNSVSATRSSSSDLPGQAETPYGSVDWQAWSANLSGKAAEHPNDPDGLGNIADNVAEALLGSYTALADSGSYTPEAGERIADDIANSLRANISYATYSEGNLRSDADVSYERMLTYRSDLRVALEPLLNNPGYELSIFANYIDTGDAKYADQLNAAAKNYRDAVEKAAMMTVPKDALSQHIGILNALSEFGAILERMTVYASDAFATAALLRTYNESEAHLFASFSALAEYYTRK